MHEGGWRISPVVHEEVTEYTWSCQWQERISVGQLRLAAYWDTSLQCLYYACSYRDDYEDTIISQHY